MMLEVVERSFISIKHCLQHHPTFFFVLRCEQQCCIRSAITLNSVARARAPRLWVSMVMVYLLHLFHGLPRQFKLQNGEQKS